LRLLLPRQIAEVTLDRFDDEAPLRLIAYFAERDELVACGSGQAETDLRVVLDSLASFTGGRTSDFSTDGFAFCCSRRAHLSLC
jgi:hypothetical protein